MDQMRAPARSHPGDLHTSLKNTETSTLTGTEGRTGELAHRWQAAERSENIQESVCTKQHCWREGVDGSYLNLSNVGALHLHVTPGGNPSGKGSNPVEIRRALSLKRSTMVLTSIPSDALSWPCIMSPRSCSGHGARAA